MYFIRSFYYKLIKKIAEIDHIEHFTGFGLYDKSFITILKNLNDPMPYLRGIVAEFGGRRQEIYYEQKKRDSYRIYFHRSISKRISLAHRISARPFHSPFLHRMELLFRLVRH